MSEMTMDKFKSEARERFDREIEHRKQTLLSGDMEDVWIESRALVTINALARIVREQRDEIQDLKNITAELINANGEHFYGKP